MSRLTRLSIGWDALFQLGPQRMAEIGLYRLGLLTGHYQRLTPAGSLPGTTPTQVNLDACPKPPPARLLSAVLGNHAPDLLVEANEIVSGQVRLFGDPPRSLNLIPPGDLRHWTEFETGRIPWGVEDVKYLWEPARFGWAVILARAFQLTRDDTYAQTFERLLDAFIQSNPTNLGQNWASAQEVAIRLVCLSFALTVFGADQRSSVYIQDHAARIPPTLVYARAQNNNHLLSEAVGLYTAAALLPNHPHAQTWRKTGWTWMNHCFQHQIGADGSYIQHSMNYHRMLLQLALWARSIAHNQGEVFPQQSQVNLAQATLWMLERLDPISGRTPNLGHNDGTYIFPFACGGYSDYRPVAQAASRAFLGAPCLPPGAWDEMSLWFGDQVKSEPLLQGMPDLASHLILRDLNSWASLRAQGYTTRPAQADQLHLDLWWHGENIALDPGTFQYNAAPPWENALVGTAVHNTVIIENHDQMRRVGRFLWLDWAQAYTNRPLPGTQRLEAYHEGYKKRFKIVHLRELSLIGKDHWQVKDQLIPHGQLNQPLTYTLHWLLPDLPWQLDQHTLRLESPHGPIVLSVGVQQQKVSPKFQLIRAGQVLVGPLVDSPIFGWFSPTYGVKIPALALRVHFLAVPPLEIETSIKLG